MRRLKGRWKPDVIVRNIRGGVKEIDCGMGLTELKKEIDYFRIEPVMQESDPVWKKPLVFASLWASGAAIGLGMMLAGSGIGLLLLVAGMAWLAVVAGANATVKKERYPNWMATCRHSRKGNARKRSMKRRCRRSVSASIVTARSSEARKRTKEMTTSRSKTARCIGTAGTTTAEASLNMDDRPPGMKDGHRAV